MASLAELARVLVREQKRGMSVKWLGKSRRLEVKDSGIRIDQDSGFRIQDSGVGGQRAIGLRRLEQEVIRR
jgi:hypothetical protein